MTPLSHLLPPLPGFTALARTYAPWARERLLAEQRLRRAARKGRQP